MSFVKSVFSGGPCQADSSSRRCDGPASNFDFTHNYPQQIAYRAEAGDQRYWTRSPDSMDSIDTKSGSYPDLRNSNGFRSPTAGQMFGSFDSPSQSQRHDINGKESPEAHSAKKRKRLDEEHEAANDGSASYNSMGHSYTPSNPDLDSYIRSKRKPREKKACQVCRKRKVACDQQQPCLNCIERRYPELCVYENSSEHLPTKSEAGVTTLTTAAHHHHQSSENQHHSRHASMLTPADTNLGYSPEKMPVAGAPGEMVTIPRDSFEKLLAKLDQFQRSSSHLNAEIRGLISGGVTTAGAAQGTGAVIFNATTSITNVLTADPDPITDGIHSQNQLTGQTVHVGGNSVPAFVMAHSSHLEELVGTSVLPAFGLENESATYPFVSLSDLRQGRLSRVFDLCKTLPPEADINRYFSSFRDISGVVYPAVASIEKFENDLFQFHIARAEALSQPVPIGIDEQGAYGKGLGWIGLLFATMASGCQCTDVSAKELDLASRVFVCCSFECLRMTNFLSNPSLENIQTLLVLGNVISNTMNAGVAWSLLGMTTRLAQVLGLHRPCRDNIPQHIKDERCKIAWTMMWQESLLSITFDRAPASTAIFFAEKSLPYDSYGPDGSWSYAGCMYQVTKVGLELLQDRRQPRSTTDMLQRMQQYEQELRHIMGNAAAHLKSSQHCQSLKEQLQHWALYLHTSYIMSEVCREAIKPKISQTELATTMKQTCLDSLTNTVRAFLGLNRLTAFASHSWSALSRGLSSALVLGILGQAGEKNDEVHALLNQLLMLLHEVMARNNDGATELSTPIKRWIATLTRLTAGKSVGPGSTGSASTSPIVELDSDDSPYAQADSIIWGSYL
jgi:hypothetical protein